jgi:hypothetical protein
LLKEHREQVGGVAPRCVGKRVAGDDAVPFFCAADKEVRYEPEAFGRLDLKQALELGTRLSVASKDEVAALEQCPGFAETQLGRQVTQIPHGDGPVAADVHAPQQSYINRHVRVRVSLFSSTGDRPHLSIIGAIESKPLFH